MNIKNTFLIAAVTISLGDANVAVAERTSNSPIPKRNIPRVAVPLGKQELHELPPPGIYNSTPYSCVVIVPEPVDPSFEHLLGADRQLDNCVIRPHTHLEPKK
jgi:hypothetical protein